MKYSALVFIISILICFPSNAQTIDIPIDRVKALLCKKWVQDYFIYGTQKVPSNQNIQSSYYEFKKDNTFLYYTSSDKEKNDGLWEYIPEKKMIRFGTKGNYDTVFSLEENKLITQIKVVEGTPRMLQVFKISN